MPGTLVFQAGTTMDEDGRLVTAGGRVLSVRGPGRQLSEARWRPPTRAVAQVQFEGMQYRRDIGKDVS